MIDAGQVESGCGLAEAAVKSLLDSEVPETYEVTGLFCPNNNTRT